MKSQLRHFLFGTSLNDNKVLNTGWLLFRLHIGLSLAIHAGWPKMYTITAPGWFSEQVAGLGFTFPSPQFWAAMASWGEFAGGICIAFGLLTRFAALQLAFQFFVISFLWYDTPEPVTGMYFQQTLFWGYVLAAFAGGGRYSLDKIIMRKRKINSTLPSVKTALASMLLLIGISSSAQKGPLNGSGKIVNKTFDCKNFDKIQVQDLNGTINIEAGKEFSVTVAIDDNLEKLLKVSENDAELKMELEGNNNNKMYIEETNIKINITMPEVSAVKHSSNSNMIITGIRGRYFSIKNAGNGTVRAEELTAKAIKVAKRGNGSVIIKTDNSFSASGSGNGDVINKGEGKPENGSAIDGNGEIKYGSLPEIKPAPAKSVQVKIKNETDELIELTVKYPRKGSYGIDVRAYRSLKESFPVGTKFFRGGQFTIFKKPLYEVTAETNQVFTIKQ